MMNPGFPPGSPLDFYPSYSYRPLGVIVDILALIGVAGLGRCLSLSRAGLLAVLCLPGLCHAPCIIAVVVVFNRFPTFTVLLLTDLVRVG